MISACFSSLKPPFQQKSQKFTKFAVLEPKFTQNFHSKASDLAKIQFFKPYFFFSKIQFFKPYFFSQKLSSLSPYFGAYPFF